MTFLKSSLLKILCGSLPVLVIACGAKIDAGQAAGKPTLGTKVVSKLGADDVGKAGVAPQDGSVPAAGSLPAAVAEPAAVDPKATALCSVVDADQSLLAQELNTTKDLCQIECNKYPANSHRVCKFGLETLRQLPVGRCEIVDMISGSSLMKAASGFDPNRTTEMRCRMQCSEVSENLQRRCEWKSSNPALASDSLIRLPGKGSCVRPGSVFPGGCSFRGCSQPHTTADSVLNADISLTECQELCKKPQGSGGLFGGLPFAQKSKLGCEWRPHGVTPNVVKVPAAN